MVQRHFLSNQSSKVQNIYLHIHMELQHSYIILVPLPKNNHTKTLLFSLSMAFFSLFLSFHIGYKDSTFLEAPTPSHDASTPPCFASEHIPSMPLCHPIVTFQKSHPSPKHQEKWSLISSASRKSYVQ